MNTVFILITFLILVPVGLYLRNKFLREKHFELKFKQFNENRYNPVSRESFRDFFNVEYAPINFMGSLICFNITKANHRDGDKLVSNLKKDVHAKIKDHLKIGSNAKNSIISLGYTFKKKENLITFIALLTDVLPTNSTIAFPINKEWFICAKSDKNNKIGLSYKLNYFEA